MIKLIARPSDPYSHLWEMYWAQNPTLHKSVGAAAAEDDDEDFEDRGDDFDPDDDLDDDDFNGDDDDDGDLDLDDNEEDEDDIEDDGDDEDVSNVRIPKSRLDEVISQREEEKARSRWLEAQLEKLLAQDKSQKKEEAVEAAPEFDFDSAEDAYAEAILEGDTSKASKIRKDIGKARDALHEFHIKQLKKELSAEAGKTAKTATEDAKFDDLTALYEEKYPFLNVDSDQYNEDAVDDVNTLMTGYIARGKSKAAALKAAVEKVVKMNAPAEKPTLGKRKQSAVKKNIKASKRQPPKNRGKTREVTNDGDVTIDDLEKMSLEEFRALPAKVRRELRGD